MLADSFLISIWVIISVFKLILDIKGSPGWGWEVVSEAKFWFCSELSIVKSSFSLNFLFLLSTSSWKFKILDLHFPSNAELDEILPLPSLKSGGNFLGLLNLLLRVSLKSLSSKFWTFLLGFGIFFCSSSSLPLFSLILGFTAFGFVFLFKISSIELTFKVSKNFHWLKICE